MSKSKWKMPVVGTEIDGTRVLRFESQREAGRNGYRQSAISDCVNGKRGSYRGFRWEEDESKKVS